ncbi:MAG: hypothetical protein ABL909_08230 [Sphingopyxis sp.]
MTTLSLRFAVAAALMLPAPAFAQASDIAPAPVNDGTLRINQVTVYGDDPCPQSSGDDIVVCGRLAEDDRYRIPTELRGNPNDPQRESWTNRVESLERVGRTGTDSCSPAGLGGFTGCMSQIIDRAYAERRQAAGHDWTDAIETARRARVEGFDADAQEVEAQIRRDEEARIAREAATEAGAGTGAETDPDPAPLPSPLAVPPPR